MIHYESGAIYESFDTVVVSNGWRHESGNGIGVHSLLQNVPNRVVNRVVWWPVLRPASRPTAVQSFCKHSGPGHCLVETRRKVQTVTINIRHFLTLSSSDWEQVVIDCSTVVTFMWFCLQFDFWLSVYTFSYQKKCLYLSPPENGQLSTFFPPISFS